mgnify:FL=1
MKHKSLLYAVVENREIIRKEKGGEIHPFLCIYDFYIVIAVNKLNTEVYHDRYSR